MHHRSRNTSHLCNRCHPCNRGEPCYQENETGLFSSMLIAISILVLLFAAIQTVYGGDDLNLPTGSNMEQPLL